MFTFGLKGGYEAGVKLVSNVKLFSHLANIGDTRSLIIHPASTTHRQLSDAQKMQAGAGPGRGAALDRARGHGRHHRRSRAGAGGGLADRAARAATHEPACAARLAARVTPAHARSPIASTSIAMAWCSSASASGTDRSSVDDAERRLQA